MKITFSNVIIISRVVIKSNMCYEFYIFLHKIHGGHRESEIKKLPVGERPRIAGTARGSFFVL